MRRILVIDVGGTNVKVGTAGRRAPLKIPSGRRMTPARMSTRVIDPSPWFNVHTAPSPTVRKRGFAPTGIVSSTTLVCALTRVSTFFSLLVIHTALPPNATANDPGGR